MTISLKSKKCFITGATGGLGKAIAIEMASRGCDIFLIGRKIHILEKLTEFIKNKYSSCSISFAVCDLSDENQINMAAEKAVNAIGNIDILINAAGIFPVRMINDTSIQLFEECFNINVKAPFILSKIFNKKMVNNNWGRIVNIGSSSSYAGFKGTAAYCSSKHAILGLGRAMYSEWKEHNIRVFTISPGSMQTEMGRDVVGQDYDTFINPNELSRFIVDVIEHDDNMITEEVRVNRIMIQ